MTRFTLTALSTALLLVMSTGAMAAGMSKADYKTAAAHISTQYKEDKAACKAMTGNAQDICIEEAKGKENIAKAELEETYHPSEKRRYNVRLAKADAVYEVAKEKCDDLAGNAKDVCRKEAKSAYVAAKADANVVEKTSDANTTARDKKDDANATAHAAKADAQRDAETKKRDAAYGVAKEKCDALADTAKTRCIKDAKAMYGQN